MNAGRILLMSEMQNVLKMRNMSDNEQCEREVVRGKKGEEGEENRIVIFISLYDYQVAPLLGRMWTRLRKLVQSAHTIVPFSCKSRRVQLMSQ